MITTLNKQERDAVIDALRYKTSSLQKRIQYATIYHNGAKKSIKELIENLEQTRKMYNQLKDHFNIVIDDSKDTDE